MNAAPSLEALATPLAWTGADSRILGCNPAFARWLGVGVRRLVGQPLASLESQGDALIDALRLAPDAAPRRHRRIAFAVPGLAAVRFADTWLSPHGEGWLLEAHPVDEFPGDTAGALPAAIDTPACS